MSKSTSLVPSISSSEAASNVLFYIGVATCAYLLFRMGRVLVHFARPPVLHRYLHPTEDTWALVTGASDGIGRALAHELCARGFHVILHGRNEAKLQGVQAALRRAHPARATRLYVADAVRAAACDDFVQSLEPGLRLTVLVNNVGGGGALPTPLLALAAHTPDMVAGVLALNAGFTARLTAALLPVLGRQPPALVVNVSSLTRMGMPLLAVYAGAKAFLVSFSEALQAEVELLGQTIDVHCIEVGQVETTGANPVSFFNPDPRTFARAALDRVGKGDVTQYGYWPQALQITALKLLPASLRRKIVNAGTAKAKQALEKKS